MCKSVERSYVQRREREREKKGGWRRKSYEIFLLVFFFTNPTDPRVREREQKRMMEVMKILQTGCLNILGMSNVF
jgi:hypothetical protein